MVESVHVLVRVIAMCVRLYAAARICHHVPLAVTPHSFSPNVSIPAKVLSVCLSPISLFLSLSHLSHCPMPLCPMSLCPMSLCPMSLSPSLSFGVALFLFLYLCLRL